MKCLLPQRFLIKDFSVISYIMNFLMRFFYTLTVLAEQDSAAAQQYIRQGSPTALRAELWALILNISSQPEVRRKKDGPNLRC